MTDRIECVYNTRLKKYTDKFIDVVWEKSELSPFFWQKISKVYDLNNESFDVVIDTQKAVPRTIALKRIKSKTFISSAANWIFSDLKPKKIKKVPQFYVKNILEMLDLVSDYKKNFSFQIQIPKEIDDQLSHVFEKGKKYLGIAPGSNTPKRIWNIEKYIEVAKYFEDRQVHPVFFLGPIERDLRQMIVNSLKQPIFPEEKVKNFSSLETVIASTKFLDCAIANDSGVSQMLSTNLCSLIKICGPTSAVKFINDDYSKIDFISSHSFGGENVNLIPIEAVINKIEQVLHCN
jgi:ADP-heptose:LPS heptosyltransferase